jgi:hypothetical protein
MELTSREWWTAIHGMMFGALFLLAFAGGLAGLYSLRPAWLTVSGMRERLVRLNIGTMVMAFAAWGTVITGTWIVYPWYRLAPPKGTTGAALEDFPRYALLASENTAGWHEFAMEWKEHIAWIAPILATAVAFIVWRYGRQLSIEPKLRNVLIVVFFLAFGTAAVAGLFGAFITKAAPVH